MSSKLSLLLGAIMPVAVVIPGSIAAAQERSQATPGLSSPVGEERELGKLVYLGAQAAAERAGVLTKDRPIVVATMVSIDDFNKSSTFGRLASQLISNRLSQRGYLVKDVTYMRALTLKPGTGELVLSRDAAQVSASVNAQAVVAGTYAVAGREIYLNIRFLKPDDGEILSSADVVIPLDHNTETLVAAAN